MTLNNGRQETMDDKISLSDQELIAEFIKNKGITKIAPSQAFGIDYTQSSKDMLALKRQEFRDARKKEAADKIAAMIVKSTTK